MFTPRFGQFDLVFIERAQQCSIKELLFRCHRHPAKKLVFSIYEYQSLKLENCGELHKEYYCLQKIFQNI